MNAPLKAPLSRPVILRQLADLRRQVKDWKCAGDRVGVVPTMGALHAGHLSLVSAAKKECERVIVTIFVNPKQFNSPEDLANYPRTEHEDAEKIAPLGADVIYCPDPDQIYPDGFATNVSVVGLTNVLCGAHREGHFDGVATVVSKLLLQTAADCAFFGEKDFQQLQLVRRLVADLDIDCEIIGCSTVRDQAGLALSSRNLRLGGDAREQAQTVFSVLEQAAKDLRRGKDFDAIRTEAAARLAASAVRARSSAPRAARAATASSRSCRPTGGARSSSSPSDSASSTAPGCARRASRRTTSHSTATDACFCSHLALRSSAPTRGRRARGAGGGRRYHPRATTPAASRPPRGRLTCGEWACCSGALILATTSERSKPFSKPTAQSGRRACRSPSARTGSSPRS